MIRLVSKVEFGIQCADSELVDARQNGEISPIVACSCCWTAYRYSRADVFKGPPSPSTACR